MYQRAFGRGPRNHTGCWMQLKESNRSEELESEWPIGFDEITRFTGWIWAFCGLWFLLAFQCNILSGFLRAWEPCAVYVFDSIPSPPWSWWDCAWTVAKSVSFAESCISERNIPAFGNCSYGADHLRSTSLLTRDTRKYSFISKSCIFTRAWKLPKDDSRDHGTTRIGEMNLVIAVFLIFIPVI